MGKEKILCDCRGSDLLLHYLLMECPLLNKQWKWLLDWLPADRDLSPSLAIEEQFTYHFARFISNTSLGIHQQLKYSTTMTSRETDLDKHENSNKDLEFAQEEGETFMVFE